MKKIYMDFNTSTPIEPGVAEAMKPFLTDHYGNPSSNHWAGIPAKEAVEHARGKVADLLGCLSEEIVFTSGGTESNNYAIKGVFFKNQSKGNHIITTTIEHPAILKTCQFLETIGFEITYLEVDKTGQVKPEELMKAIKNNTILVSIILANNEVGTIQPIKKLCASAHKKGIIFHTDAVQAAGKIQIDVQDLNVDLLTLSGHKFHGPKGIGVLYVKKGVELEALIHGGKQENKLRAGTENVAGIAGLGKAAELAVLSVRESRKMQKLRDKLQSGIQELIPGAVLNGHEKERLPNTLNLTLPALRGESLVMALDQHGIALSSGSACKSGSPDPTHVLLAMGKNEEESHCSVRFSLSNQTTNKDIDDTLHALKVVLDEMESTVRFLPCK
ncbi:MAG: cysteine desulfurase [Calditrichia bacterium]|nr:cysteine desulfurase [Calditrichia bacterium]